MYIQSAKRRQEPLSSGRLPRYILSAHALPCVGRRHLLLFARNSRLPMLNPVLRTIGLHLADLDYAPAAVPLLKFEQARRPFAQRGGHEMRRWTLQSSKPGSDPPAFLNVRGKHFCTAKCMALVSYGSLHPFAYPAAVTAFYLLSPTQVEVSVYSPPFQLSICRFIECLSQFSGSCAYPTLIIAVCQDETGCCIFVGATPKTKLEFTQRGDLSLCL